MRQTGRGEGMDRRGPQTALIQAFVDLTGARSETDLLEGLSQGYYASVRSRPLASDCRTGDSVAVDAIRWAAEELASLALGVIRQLGFEKRSFEIVFVGSMYNGGPLLLDPLRDAVLAEAPAARFVQLTAPPVAGAVLLGMQAAGLPADASASRLSPRRVRIGSDAANGQPRLAFAEELDAIGVVA